MNSYAMSEEQSNRLNTVVSDLAVQSEADAVLMSDYMGNTVAQVLQVAGSGVENVAALAAGSFAATRELAVLIGEPAFYSIFHKGQSLSIYMQSVTEDFLILAVFGRSTTIGLVKLYVEKACKELKPLLDAMTGQSVTGAGGREAFEMGADDVFQDAGEKTEDKKSAVDGDS